MHCVLGLTYNSQIKEGFQFSTKLKRGFIEELTLIRVCVRKIKPEKRFNFIVCLCLTMTLMSCNESKVELVFKGVSLIV